MLLSLNSCSTNKKLNGKYGGGYYEFQFYKKDSMRIINKRKIVFRNSVLKREAL